MRLEGVFTTTSVWSSVKALKDLDRLCGFREPGKDRADHMVKLLVCCPEVLCSSRGLWWWNQNAGASSSKVLGVSCTWYLHNCWFSGAWVKTLECGVLPFKILSDNPSPLFSVLKCVCPWRERRALEPSNQLESQVVVSCLMWMLGTKFRSYARATSACHH